MHGSATRRKRSFLLAPLISAEVSILLINVVITVVIAVALICVFCFRAVRMDKCNKTSRSFVLVPCFETDEKVEGLVKALYWDEVFKCSGNTRGIILLCNSDNKASEFARIVAEELDNVYAVDISELEGFLKNKGGV